jgi:septal ring factor EnvC (AmiA/AmiB activator)
MNTRKMILVVSVLCMAVLLAGCGQSTAKQLKKTQADLAACDKQAGELKNEVVKTRGDLAKITAERDKLTQENMFLAKKANSNEKLLTDKDAAIAALKAEIEKSDKALSEAKAAAEKAAAAAAPVAPAAPAKTGMPQ